MQRVYTPNNQNRKGPGRIAWWIVIASVVVILLGALSVLLLLIPVTRSTDVEPTRAVVAVVPTQDTPLPATLLPTETVTATAVVESPTAFAPGTDTPVAAATATLPLPTNTQIPPQATATQQPVIQPTATAEPTTASTAWRAEYFNNPNLAGSPVLVRDDANLAFDWGAGAPAAGVPADSFSVRWQHTRYFNTGTYRFYARGDDGVRVWLDNQLIIDQWHDAAGTTYTADRSLAAGNHTLQVAYYEHTGEARIQLWWEAIGQFPQWQAEYFANSILSGAPALIRNDSDIYFDWGGSSLAPGVPADNFSVRWTRTLPFDDGTYRFHVLVDDGVRLYVDGALVLNEWRDGNQRQVTADRQLSAGSHQIRVEYYEHGGDARVRVWWEKLSPAHYPDWKGEYWTNRQLSGTPALVRNDVNLDFNWGHGAPAAGLPADNFSARWTRTLHFEDGRYRFQALVDDGMRLYVDGALIIDQWRDGSQREVTADVNLSRGNHVVRVDYYERGGDARIRTRWERVGAIGYPDWKGEYWNNREFKGNPVLVRNDTRIDFDWGLGSPDPALPADNFAVRWSRNVNFEAGVYRFYALVDDGVRVTVGGSRILDRWHDSSADRPYQADINLSAGTHPVVVEYYEHQFGAEAEVWWERVDTLPPTATPTQPATAVPTATATSSPTTVPTATPTRPATTVPTATPSPTATEPPPTETPSPTATKPPPTATPSPTPIPQAAITLKPGGGSANTQVTVTGQGFAAETAVHIYLGRQGEAPYQVVQASGQSNRNGKFNLAFLMPANWPDGTAITEDVVVVYATGTSAEVSASANFNYRQAAEPGLTLNPNQGNTGTRVLATGSGFPAGAHVNLYLRIPDEPVDAATYGEAIANSKGNFVIDFTIPSVWSDGSPVTGDAIRVIAATDDDSIRVRSIFTLLKGVWEHSGYFVQ